AIDQYAADNKGALPAGIPDTTAGAGTISDTDVDICATLVTQYLAALPVDPLTGSGARVSNCGAAYNTNYQVVKSTTDNRVTVSATAAELGESISVTR